MSTGTLSSISDGDTTSSNDVNQHIDALKDDFVPRNVSGVAESDTQTLGESSTRWLKAFVAAGYWVTGDIKSHHSYNDIADIGQGWFPCNGSIINKVNYDLIFGDGSWDIYVIASELDGKYSPDMIGKYLIGSASTTEDGGSAIATVGNGDNEKDLSHTHYLDAHGHQWYETTGGANSLTTVGHIYSGQSYNNSSDLISFSGAIDAHSSWVAAPTDPNLTTPISVQPESIETIFYIRIA